MSAITSTYAFTPACRVADCVLDIATDTMRSLLFLLELIVQNKSGMVGDYNSKWDPISEPAEANATRARRRAKLEANSNCEH